MGTSRSVRNELITCPTRPRRFSTLSLEEKLALRSQYAAGQGILPLCRSPESTGYPGQPVESLFRLQKWQASSWKLILTGNAPQEGASALQESLATYKYRNDVLVLTDPDPGLGARLIGAALCPCHPGKRPLLPLPGCRKPGLRRSPDCCGNA